jgi:cytochrome c oxidase cbb3-type subunit III
MRGAAMKIRRIAMGALIAGCIDADAAQQAAPPAQSPNGQWGSAAPFVQHPDNIQPGLALSRPFAQIVNPFEGNTARRDEGAKLFIAYNCMDCHGADGSGAMGPSLQDGRWHFGGSNGEVFQSIYEGRPDGMPAWGGRISDADIWRLTTYVRSVSAGKKVSTENFTGKTVERSGH